MTTKPHRVQRKRTKGWRKPKNTIYVGRGTIWGNPFPISKNCTPEMAVERFAMHLHSYFSWVLGKPYGGKEYEDWIGPLRGKNLMCYCPLNQPCHADILLELANARKK